MAYDPTDLDRETQSGRVNIVRLLVGDTNTSDVQLTDEEIIYYLGLTNQSPEQSSVLCAYSLGSKYARLVDTELEGVLKEDYSQRSENYFKLSSQLKLQNSRSKLSVSGGVSGTTSTPQFYIGQFEYPTSEESTY